MLSKSHTDKLKSCHTLLYSDTSHAVSVYKTTIFFTDLSAVSLFDTAKVQQFFKCASFLARFFLKNACAARTKKAKGSVIPFALVSYSLSFIGCSISYIIGIPTLVAI